jgi:hypothetical protein
MKMNITLDDKDLESIIEAHLDSLGYRKESKVTFIIGKNQYNESVLRGASMDVVDTSKDFK